jgi:hypothetical protein
MGRAGTFCSPDRRIAVAEESTMILVAPAHPFSRPPPVLHLRPSPAMASGKKPKRGTTQSVEEQFYAGNYAAIVRECVDGGNAARPLADLPFVVGALAFIGRLEEARALFSSQFRRRRAPSDETEIVAARFFLGVAYCRAGRIDEARSEFLHNVRSRHGQSLARFYVFQGLGCYRYFTGRLRQSARQALYALEHAFIADFPYGRLLATDLRGHTLVQLGQIQSGLSLLETARTLAGSLALEGNVAALDCAIGIYRARFGVVPVRQAMGDLNQLLSQASPEDSYSERSLRTELAIQAALAGEGDAAWGLLERLGTEHVPDGGDTRARIRFLLACANVARLRYGAASMLPFVSEARALLSNRKDIALEVEVLCMELVAASSPDEAARVCAELLTLHRSSGIERVWLRAAERSHSAPFSVMPGAEALEEDRLGALYVACLRASPELASRLIASGHWGLLPLALGLNPGRRILVFGRRLIIEDHGNVSVLADPPEGSLRFLSALGDGQLRTKEELLALVWGITSYRPDAHDPVIHTAVSRLRAQLGVRGHWVEAALGGYRLAQGVELASPFESGNALPREPEHFHGLGLRAAEVAALLSPGPARDPVLALLAKNGPVSSSDVASHLGVSEMTALRRLREHVEQGAVTRDGKGKNTRYRLGTS